MDGWKKRNIFSLSLSLSLYSFVYDGKRVVLTADGGDAAHQLSRGMEQKGGLAVFVWIARKIGIEWRGGGKKRRNAVLWRNREREREREMPNEKMLLSRKKREGEKLRRHPLCCAPIPATWLKFPFWFHLPPFLFVSLFPFLLLRSPSSSSFVRRHNRCRDSLYFSFQSIKRPSAEKPTTVAHVNLWCRRRHIKSLSPTNGALNENAQQWNQMLPALYSSIGL